MIRWLRCLVALGCLSISTVASAQGLLIATERRLPLPRPIPQSSPTVTYALKELSVQARIADQVAQVQVSQSFVNTGSQQLEVQFVFPLPYDGAIDQLTLLVDGKEYPAQLLPAKEARARYEAIVRSSRDPALLEWLGTGMFQTSVFPVPPGATRQVSLRYSQLLRKDQGLTDFLFPLSTAKYTAKPVEKIDIQVSIDSTVDIKNVYSPTHAVDIQRPDGKHAIIHFQRSNEIPGSDFRLFYDVGTGPLQARVLTYRPKDNEDGYFLLLASPPALADMVERPAKTVLFIVDKSGSMSGKKIEQAKAALKFVLNNLREGDLFNIIAYDSNVESFRPELERFSDDNRRLAIGYVEGLFAGGGTNIHGALTTGLNQLKDNTRPNFVLFMTDGLATAGERSEAKIVADAKAANGVKARVLPFGVGYDVNSRLLDRLARENFGLSAYVRPEEDIEAHVSRVYSRIATPLLTNANLSFEFDGVRPEDGQPITRQYPGQIHDLFAGEQIVVVGRYKKTGAAKVVITGQTGDKPQRYEFPADFATKTPDASLSFVEKLWATRRIGEIIDELDLKGQNDELVKELVDLSTKHGILTPYTSFLADESSRPSSLAAVDSFRVTNESLSRLRESEGKSGVAQRGAKFELQNATTAPGLSALGGAAVREIDSDAVVRRFGVRNSGAISAFGRNVQDAKGNVQKRLITRETAELDLEKDKDKITVVDRYTDSYFTLIADNTITENQLLSQQQPDEELLIQLRGKPYLIK